MKNVSAENVIKTSPAPEVKAAAFGPTAVASSHSPGYCGKPIKGK